MPRAASPYSPPPILFGTLGAVPFFLIPSHLWFFLVFYHLPQLTVHPHSLLE